MFELTIDQNHKVSNMHFIWNMNDEYFQGLIAAATSVKLSSKQGHAIAHQFINSTQDGFRNADFSPSAGLYADTISWQWSGEGAHCSGTGTINDYFAVLAKTWQPIVSAHEIQKPEIAVDTTNGIISICYSAFGCVDGRNAANRTADSFFALDMNWVLKIDGNGKIYYLDAVWDSAHPALNAAVAAVLTKLGAQVPAVPKAIISNDQGAALAQNLLNAYQQAFTTRDASVLAPLLASNVSWVHPNDIGSGSADDYLKVLSTWFQVISTWHALKPRIIVDGPGGTIHFTYGVGAHVDGHGAVNAPVSFCSNIHGQRIKVNAEHKITSIDIVCDLNDVGLASALRAVKSASN